MAVAPYRRADIPTVRSVSADNKPEFAGEWVRLEDVCAKGKSNLRQKDLKNDGPYPVYGAPGIVGFSSDYQNVDAYVAVVKDGAGVGRVMACEPRSSVLGTMQALLPGKGTDRDYLLHLVRSMDLGKGFTGSTIPHIYFKDYGKTLVRALSRGRQVEVANRLSGIDRLISQGKQQLSFLDDLVKSQFVEMFGDTYSNSKQLPSRKLGALIDFITSGSRGWSKYYSDEGDYFITIKNVRGCSISLDNVQHVHAPNNKEAERTKVQSGDVLISITADLGRTGVVSKEIADHGAYINQHLACIRLAGEDILPLYLSFFLESPGAKDQLQRKNQTGVKAGLNFDLVKSLDILVPPLALQQQFADFVARVDKLGFDVQQQIEKLETLKQSLMQEYFG